MPKSRGFTLIEILVAVLVLALGLIGLAALQATGIKNVQTAYNRSQAIHLAQDMADRIRANTSAAAVYADVDNNGPDVGQSPLPGGTNVSACLSSCTVQQLAQNDVYHWKQAIDSALPSGCGSIARGNGSASAISNGCGGQIPANVMGLTSNTYIITINWDEDGDGQVGASDPNFIMSFQLL